MSDLYNFEGILKTDSSFQHFSRDWRIKNLDDFERDYAALSVLIKDRCKVKGEQVIILQMAQQLKTRNINVVSGQLFLSSV